MHFLKLERKNHIYSRRSWLEREFTLKETKTPYSIFPRIKLQDRMVFHGFFFLFPGMLGNIKR